MTKTIVFFGDSITHCNKNKPNSGSFDLGEGYVYLLDKKIKVTHSNIDFKIINQGLNGNRSIDLVKRIDKDVLSYNPYIMILLIGINDIWRQFDSLHIKEYQITNEEYSCNVETIIKKAIDNKILPYVCSPFYLDINNQDSFRIKVLEYNEILLTLCKKYNLQFINLQKAYDRFLLKHPYTEISSDKIHMNKKGHEIITLSIYTKLKDLL